jgi:hypothetical protein
VLHKRRGDAAVPNGGIYCRGKRMVSIQWTDELRPPCLLHDVRIFSLSSVARAAAGSQS